MNMCPNACPCAMTQMYADDNIIYVYAKTTQQVAHKLTAAIPPPLTVCLSDNIEELLPQAAV